MFSQAFKACRSSMPMTPYFMRKNLIHSKNIMGR